MAGYKIELGVKLNTSDIGKQIRNYSQNQAPKINLEFNNKKANSQIDSIRKQIKNLSNIKVDLGVSGKNGAINISTSDISRATKSFENLESSILNDLNEIKIYIQSLASNNSIDGLTQSFNTLSQTLDNIIANAGNIKVVLDSSFNGVEGDAKKTTQTVKEATDAVKKMNQTVEQGGTNTSLQNTGNELTRLKNLAREIGRLDFKIEKSSLNDEVNQVKEFERQLELAKIKWNEIVRSLESQNIDIGSISTEEFVKARNKIAELEASYKDARAELSKKIELNVSDTGKYTEKVRQLKREFESLPNKTAESRVAVEQLEQALREMQTAANNDDRIAAEERYQVALQDTEVQLKRIKQANQDSINANKLEQDRINLSLTMGNWLKDNSAAAKQFGGKIKELQAELKSCNDVRLNDIKSEFKGIQKAAQLAGKTTKTLGDTLKAQFAKYSSYLSIASVFMYAEQGLRDMFEQVKAIDSALTELKKVTDETDATYNKFLTNAASRAKEIGTTIDGLVSSTADFARLGYGFEDAQGLAEVANIYAVVGDEVEGVDGATQSLISTMAAFKDEMNGLNNDDFALSIVDKMNEIGNNFAISSGGIGEALVRSASSMSAANNTLDETIALITAANTVVQNPEKIGNGLKIISMRIRGAKTELEEAGESTEGMAESTASLRAEIKALSGVDIMLDSNTFKSTYQIMDELSEKWEGLSDIAQAKCLPEYVEIHI